MAYVDSLEDEIAQSHYLIVLKPRQIVDTFSLFSGSVYVASFDFGEVISVVASGEILSLGSSSALSAGQFFYDVDTESLYVRLSGGGNPNSVYTVATYEIYCSTSSYHFNRIPTDSSTREVYFEPLISKSPVFKQSAGDTFSGYNPVQSSQMSLINADHVFERHLTSSTWNNADCDVYHLLGDAETDNVKKIVSGLVKTVSLNKSNLDLTILDRTDRLSYEWRHPVGDSFFDSTTFTNLDPNQAGKPIRKAFGLNDGVVPVNIDYNSDAPSTTNNRTWVVTNGQTGLSDVVKTVPASPVSTTTRTYVDSVTGLNVGDSVWINKAADEYKIITVVGANYIEHTALGVAATTGDTVNRAFVSNVKIIQNDTEYVALYNRDYTVSVALNGTSSGFVFVNNFEATLGMATLNPTDRVYCRVYGQQNSITLGGPAYGVNDTRTLNMSHPMQIVLFILKNTLGISDSEINQSSFTSALTDQDYGAGFMVPQNSTDSMPIYRDVISNILKSTFSKLVLDDDNKWSVFTFKPIITFDKEIKDDELLVDSVDFDFDYDDLISDSIVSYRAQEMSFPLQSSTVLRAVSTSDYARYLHGVSKSREESSIWAFDTEAQRYADRLVFLFGERNGEVKIRVKNRFFDTNLNDTIRLTRVYLPGFDVDGDTEFSQDYVITETSKGLQNISMTLNDQKGIEDNAGGW